jgi:Leucine-rich repeat (LRR) protein
LFDLGIDTVNGDHQVLTSAISTVPTLDVSNKNISSLVGIKGFTSLWGLTCNSNQLTSIDVSGMTVLQELVCNDNQMTNINLSGLTGLHNLNCGLNQLTSLNVSSLSALQGLICTHNSLNDINVSSNTFLTSLYCDVNNLTNLNLSSNANLSVLACYDNPTLSCITVADVATANANGSWQKDATASYSTNCGGIPTTEIKPAFWNATLAAITTDIVSTTSPGAQMYRFEVSNGATVVGTYDISSATPNNFALAKISGITSIAY